jgi:hypothetical protein
VRVLIISSERTLDRLELSSCTLSNFWKPYDAFTHTIDIIAICALTCIIYRTVTYYSAADENLEKESQTDKESRTDEVVSVRLGLAFALMLSAIL